MPGEKKTLNIVDQLAQDISDEVGNGAEDELDQISDSFDKVLNDALKKFNSSLFDDDGFIKKMRNLDIDETKDRDMMKNVLNNLRSDYIGAESLNQSELLLKRDMENVCTQMPEMFDVIKVIRDAIIECDVATGQVSRSLVFENHTNSEKEAYENQIKELEKKHKLLKAIKNFIVPNTLKMGEYYVQVTPYSKLFSELEALKNVKMAKRGASTKGTTVMRESHSIFSDNNLKIMMESVSPITKVDSSDAYKIEHSSSTINDDKVVRSEIRSLLENIDVYNDSSIMLSELGEEGFKNFLMNEYKEHASMYSSNRGTHFEEAMDFNKVNDGVFAGVDQDVIDTSNYDNIKGCYIKYLNPLRMVPIRMDRRIIGYYYVSTTMDLAVNSANPNGIVDLSFQHYTKDKNLVDNLANMIIRSFDKKMLERNIQLKNEIAEIIMAHKFSEGKLSFIYIPENEVCRFVVNEDEYGKGHGVLEPTMFPARMYLMLTLYNMLYTLNNNTTRVHYVKSSGLDKDYASQIQRTMRKFQSRRITIDDIYSYSGVLNKVGGMGEMVLPAGRNDFKALETDTIEAVPNPINMEFLEQQRRQAISGTGVPHLMMINAIDEADFAKTLELANARFLSTVSSYKIDFNEGITKLYQLITKYETEMEIDIITSFRFQFNAVKQQDLNITSDMIQNFNTRAELVESIYYDKNELEDDKGNSTAKRRALRLKLAQEYLPQMDFDRMNEIIKEVDVAAGEEKLQSKVNKINIDNNDLSEISEDNS